MTGRLLKNEIKRAVFSKAFLLGTAILTLFGVLSALYEIESCAGVNPDYLYESCMQNGEFTMDPGFELSSLYQCWVGGDINSLAYSLFYHLMPVCAAIPFAWSFSSEQKCGYLKNIAARVPKRSYYFAKSTAVFISGALVVLIAYAVNVLLVSAFVPYYETYATDINYNLIYFGTMLSDLFFQNPFLHMLLFILLGSLYGGIFALLCFAVSFYIKKTVISLFLPFVVFIAGGYLENLIYNNMQNSADLSDFVEFIPTQFLHAHSLGGMQMTWAVVLVTVCLLFFVVITVYFKGIKNEVY